MADTAPHTATALDPVTLAILSNRLWITNDEAAATVRRVSGSPVATEICDFNTALLRPNGDAFMVGAYFGPLSLGHDLIVKDILANYSENPGIGIDDMFICSDPYRGNTHQSDVTLVAPVHFEGECIAWTGVSIHQVDVGGPVPGSQASIGATSIFQEPLPIPPLKIVEGGVLRKDIEEEYLIRSRTRDLNALDLRAQIAANNRAKARVLECAERYGVDTLEAAIEAIVDQTTERLRTRLETLPDGTWRHRAYMDEAPGVTHVFQLAVTKTGGELCFDFTGTGPQTGAIFNCSRGGLMGGVLSSMLPILFFGMRWCPTAATRLIDVRTEPGTLVDPVWPAGMCKATTASMAMVNTITNVCLGKMLSGAADPETSGRAMAPWMAAATVQELGGKDRHGRQFGATMLDPMAGGGGARADSDGVDNGGVIRAVKLRIANVETYEFRYPLLYLHRKRLTDSGGAGTHRGGVGVSLAFTPHGVDEIRDNVMHSINYQVPATAGILGGFPGATNTMVLLRDSNVERELADGRLPTDLDQLEGELAIVPVIDAEPLRRGDVYRSTTGGGGGFGDPLWRVPEHVRDDVLAGAVSRRAADHVYGVIIGDGDELDEAATTRHRADLVRQRLEQAVAGSALMSCDCASAECRVSANMALYRADGVLHTGCVCGRLFAPADRNYKDGLARIEGPLQTAGALVNPYRIGADFTYRRFLCPGCGRTIETEVARRGDPLLHDIQLAAGGAAS
jgi:N-methylhydantoinase B